MTAGAEMGSFLGIAPTAPVLTEELVERIARDAIAEFLGGLDPVALETHALAHLGGLEGDDSVGACFIKVLKELAGVA